MKRLAGTSRKAGIGIFSVTLSVAVLSAQGPMLSPFDGTTPGVNVAGSPIAAYQMSEIDTVNALTGHVNFAIPVASIPGRGAARATVVVHLETHWEVHNVPVPYNCGPGGCSFATSYVISGNPWSSQQPDYISGLMQVRYAGDFCQGAGGNFQKWVNTLSRLTYIAPNGTETEFRDTLSYGQKQPGVIAQGSSYNRGQNFAAFDGSSSIFTAAASVGDATGCQNGPNSISGTMTTREGTSYTFGSGGFLTQIQDRNGNQLTIDRTNAPVTVLVNDAYGRQTTITQGANGTDTIQYPGEGGTPRTVTVKHANLDALLDTGQMLQQPNQMFGIPQCNGGGTSCPQQTSTYDPQGLVSEIDLPNGQSYTFKYNSSGDVTRIILPTGGMYTYTYQSPAQSVLHASNQNGEAYVITRPLASKSFYTSSSATTPVQVITYSGGVITYQDGSSEKHMPFQVNPPMLDGTQYVGWQSGLETEVDYLDTNGTTLQTSVSTLAQHPCNGTENCWFVDPAQLSSPAHDPQLQSKSVTLGSQTSKDSYLYDIYNNQTERDEYAFGSGGTAGPLFRKTLTQFKTDYVNAHILNLPVSQTVQDANGTSVAQTTYGYDETGLQDTPGIISHNSAYSTGSLVRGNATTVTRLLNDPVNGIVNRSLSTTFLYDIAGNIVTATDPRAVRHDFGYHDSDSRNTYALPTSVTSYPVLGQTGSSFTAKALQDYDIGKPLTTIDIAGNSTTYTYPASDGLDRLQSINRPDGGSTSFVYNDTPSTLSVTTSVAQTTAGAIVTATQYDGFGRKTSTSLAETGANIVTTYGYDVRGRVSCASLPFRGSSSDGCSSTNGVLTAYDGMNRVTSITEPGNAVSTKQYNANQTLERDAAGFLKLYTADSVGRLTSVQENPLSWNGGSGIGNNTLPTYTTLYGYDLLDDLTTVGQTDPTSSTSLSRAFQYDSLKRLVRATNPELGLSGNGSITYSYDDSGNLATRTDPRVTTTFSPYDGMNRVTGKSYSDGTTPAVGYAYYPSSSTAGCPKLSQGRLMSVTSGAMVNTYSCYDVLGRVTGSTQKTGSVTYSPFSYAYDKSGALASVTYPSGRVVTNTFDAAGRINQVTGPSNKNYASQVAYAPQGAIQSLTLYNGVVETWAFNPTRQQPTSLQASLGATALLNLTWGYGADSTNNGNVQSQTIARSAGLPATVSQTYQYTDPSNRLSFAIEPNLPNYGGWYQAYNYDAFGNRAIPPGYDVPNPDQTPAALSEFTVNRWKRGNGDGYDGSGNQTAVASRGNPGATVNVFTYDGENRMVTSNIANMGTVTYSYDGEGRRVQKSYTCSTGTCTTVFVYDAMGQLAAEYSTAPNTASGTQYLTADSLGSTRLVTDGSGAVTQCYDYLPFGEEIRQGFNGRGSCYPPSGVYPHPADATSMKFTGKERDVETGLDWFQARYLSGTQGRFTSPDPLLLSNHRLTDPQAWNMYAYVRNTPLTLTDRTGLDFYLDCKQTRNNGSVCQGGHVGTTTTDANGNKTFTPTVVTSASLQDPDSGVTGTVTPGGVRIATASGTYTGAFINGTPSATLQGSGVLAPFTFTITGQHSGNTLEGQFQFNGSPAQAEGYMRSHGAWSYPLDVFNIFHPNSNQYRFSDPSNPDGPSIHIALPTESYLDPGPGYGIGLHTRPSASQGNFHVDSHGTFAGHVKDVLDLLKR